MTVVVSETTSEWSIESAGEGRGLKQALKS